MSPRHAPWRDGSDFAIGLAMIGEADWLEGGEAEPWARKDPLMAAHAPLVWAETEGSRPGQAEVKALVEQATGLSIAGDTAPLWAAARQVSDDLVLMEKQGGAWRVAALSLCAPTFFSAGEVIGRSLADLHGPVTGFGERFLARVERIFDILAPGRVLQRRNWTVVNSGEAFTPDPAPVRARIPAIEPAAAGRELFLRVERQTLRRLPETGGLVFTIRVWLDPLESLAGDPEGLAAFARAWSGSAQNFRNYKRFNLYDALVEAFLRASGETYSVNGG